MTRAAQAWVHVALVASCMGAPLRLGAQSYDQISHKVVDNVETWRIDLPDITVAEKDYPTIRFKAGDIVAVKASGCVNIGKGGEFGKSSTSWRHYVYCRVDRIQSPWVPADLCAKQPVNLSYYGTIRIPGVHGTFTPLLDTRDKTFQVQNPGGADFLRLGYVAMRYNTNSYQGSVDGGFCGQCMGGEKAWVEITITHPTIPVITESPGTSHLGDTLRVAYKDLSPSAGTHMGLFGEFEGGTQPQQGSQPLSAKAAALQFPSPKVPGRYLFKIYNDQGQVLAKGRLFAVMSPTPTYQVPAANPVGQPSGPGALKDPAASAARPQIAQNRVTNTPCATPTWLPQLHGYTVQSCTHRFDDMVILVDGDPEGAGNPRHEGRVLRIKYQWEGEETSPSDLQIRRTFTRVAPDLGAQILVERTRYVAFEVPRGAHKAHLSVETFNDGRTVELTLVEPEPAPDPPTHPLPSLKPRPR